MKDRSIGIVCSSKGFGGLEMNTLQLCKGLESHGWEVRLLVNNKSRMSDSAAAFCADAQTIQQIKKRSSRSSSSILKKWLKEKPVSILFTPYNKDIAALSAYKRYTEKNIRLVYQQHMKVGVKKKDWLHTRRYKMLDLWIAPLEYLKQEVMEKTRVEAEKIMVIPFGLEAERILTSNISKHEARAKLGIHPAVFLIGVLGRVDPKKGQDFLIHVLHRLQQQEAKKYALLIMGDITPHEGNKYIDQLHDLVQKSGLVDKVYFKSSEQDINIFYKAIDVFAMSSHGETFGMVTLEAMLSERPVIGVNTDGTKELSQHGKLIKVHRLNHIPEFLEALQTIESNPENTAFMVNKAKNEVLAKYGMKQMLGTTEAALTGLL